MSMLNEQSKPLSREELELRSKDWQELTEQQKIERQRDVIKNLQRSLSSLQNQLYQLQSNFNQHQHGEKGILIPLMNNGFVGGLTASAKEYINPNYF